MKKLGLSQLTGEQRRSLLRPKIRRGHLTIAPGVFEMISAKIADDMDFDALYMTGYGTVASYLGLTDAGCGHMLGRRVVPVEDMVDKIRVAVETRNDPNFLIIARTDARTTLGLDEALRRAEQYAKAGADLLFVESPESEEEMRQIGRSFDQPLVANMVEGGRTPILSAHDLATIGYGLAIFPATAFLAATQAFESVYETLKADGSTNRLSTPLYPFSKMSQKMGFDWVSEFDASHAKKS